MDEDQRGQFEVALDAAADALRGAQPEHSQPARPGGTAEQRHHPGLAPPGIRPPSWWKGDQHAYSSSTRAMHDIQQADATGGASLGRGRNAQPRRRPRR